MWMKTGKLYWKDVVRCTVDIMKGVSLPINAVVLLVLAIIVVAASAMFFMGIIGQSKTEMDNDQIRTLCCTRLTCEEENFADILSSCKIEGLDEDGLKGAFGIGVTPENIKSECGCGGSP